MKTKKLIIAALFILALSCKSENKTLTESTYYTNDQGLALSGYDVVDYLVKNEAVEGKKEFSCEYEGSTWLFENQENLTAFKNDPKKYLPEYGGYCAYGVSENHKSPTDGKAFTVKDGKLYLNYNLEVKKLWLPDTATRITKADNNWKGLNETNKKECN